MPLWLHVTVWILLPVVLLLCVAMCVLDWVQRCRFPESRSLFIDEPADTQRERDSTIIPITQNRFSFTL